MPSTRITRSNNGTISDPALDLLHPSIAVNQFGDAVIGFTAAPMRSLASASLSEDL